MNTTVPIDIKPLRMRWVMIGFAFVATVLNYVDRLAFSYLSTEGALRELIPDDSFGFITSAFFIAYMLSNAFSGFVIDRLGTRIGYSIYMCFWTTASLLHALARLPFHFGIARFLLGVGEAGNWPAAIRLTREWFPSEERATASGIFNSGSAVGAVVAPPLIVYLITVYDWQTAFIIIGSVGYLWVFAFWFTYYVPTSPSSTVKAKPIPVKQLLKNRFVWTLTLSKIFMDPVWYFISFWIGRYLVDVHGWNLAKVGIYAMIPFIAADAGNILGGLFTQSIIKKGMTVHKARKFAVALFGSMTAGSLILGPFIIYSPYVALCILAVAGFGHAAYTSNTMAFPADVVPKSATASVWGLASAGSGLGGALFQSLSGITVEKLSTTYSYSTAYNTVFIGYGTLALAALFVILFLMAPLVKEKTLDAFEQGEKDLK
jgi:MFS transporter, ACS family, hexuronate transporter